MDAVTSGGNHQIGPGENCRACLDLWITLCRSQGSMVGRLGVAGVNLSYAQRLSDTDSVVLTVIWPQIGSNLL